MTSQVVDITSELITKLQTLAPEQQQQVLDFVEFFSQKYTQPQKLPEKRIPDLNNGEICMSDDFQEKSLFVVMTLVLIFLYIKY